MKKTAMETAEFDREQRKRSLEAGMKLTHAKPGDEVVISGMAGRFPDSDNVYHFRDNLYSKVDMVSCDNRRWDPKHPEIPQRTGKLNHINKFDAGFFGVHERQAHNMDPMCRMLLERSVEAVMDAGVNPHSLAGSRTGVFVGVCFSETEKASFYERLEHQSYGVLGCTRSMLAKRISYALQLEGPSFVTDTACSSSLFALEHAYRAIRNGNCDQALVAGSNLCLHPIVSLQFARLGVLSWDGSCKSFDNAANGYARSEAACVIFLQRTRDARRIYGQIVHSKTNCDGFKEQGITYPSGSVQRVLLDEFYEECGVDPNSLSYVEAHGTGTKVGDPEELGTLQGVFCSNRTTPLLIGSVKSNIGHNEPASGLCSVVKVLIGMEHGFIPPNIHYKVPRSEVTALEEGIMKVVSEKTRWPVPAGEPVVAGINSFGFGGANGHVLLKWNEKEKQSSSSGALMLVCISGRTEDGIDLMMNSVVDEGVDVEQIRLIHEIFSKDILNHYFRGFALIRNNEHVYKSTKEYEGFTNPLQFVFHDFDTDWLQVDNELLSHPLFAETIHKIQHVLTDLKINLTDIMTTPNTGNAVYNMIGSTAIQIASVEVLKHCNIICDSILGSGIGQIVAAYADSVISLEQAVLIACNVANNVNNNTTEKKFVKAVLSIMNRKYLPSTTKWKPFAENKPVTTESFAKLLLTKQDIEVPTNCIVVEFGQCLIKPSELNGVQVVNFLAKKNADLESFYISIGRLYQSGVKTRLEVLHPPASYPVSRGTRMISPFVGWNHDHDWFVTVYKAQEKMRSGYRVVSLGLKGDDWHFISGHVIDGRCLFPATGYLNLIWETLAMMVGKLTSDMKVCFENVKFRRACTVPTKTNLELILSIHKGSGLFEVAEGGTAVVSGRITEVDEREDTWANLPIPARSNRNGIMLKENDIYKELRLRGYNYTGQFRALKECNKSATLGLIAWTGNWITFMDNVLQMQILQEDSRNLYVPTSIQQLTVDANAHIKIAKDLGDENSLIPVYAYPDLKIIRSGAIEIRGLNASQIVRRKQASPVVETYKFVANAEELSLLDAIRAQVQIAVENDPSIHPQVVEILNDTDEPLMTTISDVFNDLPVIQADMTIFTNRSLEVNGINVEDRKITSDLECFLIVGRKLLDDIDALPKLFSAMKPNGFLISRENLNGDSKLSNNVQVICDHTCENERIVLLRKRKDLLPSNTLRIDSSDRTFDWLNDLKKLQSSEHNVILYSQQDSTSGILGLINCLRREPNGDKVRGVFIMDADAPEFDPNIPYYKQQLDKNLVVNVLNNGRWGTFRHLILDDNALISSEHCYVNVTIRGDLSSLKWIQGPLFDGMSLEPEMTLIHVYCAAINFRDVMTASGKISVDVVTRNRLEQECVQGFEFSGRDPKYGIPLSINVFIIGEAMSIQDQNPIGTRLMGMVTSGALATLVVVDSHLIWRIPDSWSMEEATTIPVVYGTVLYAFFLRAGLKRGQSILIHSGTGGVGQAAINVALHYGCTVFTTVGTAEKRDFIRRHYPQIRPAHIGNSRDTSFEDMVKVQTRGRGVDLVLNSLAEEKLQASIRCVAARGTFIEIGKFDLANDSPLRMELFRREASFQGIMLDALFVCDPVIKRKVSSLLVQGIKEGYIRPLPRTCFKMDEIEPAFRYMATGKHIGKVLVRIRKEEDTRLCLPTFSKFTGIPRFYCKQGLVYVILGGLGGFGLELADWLILRGARNLVLTTTSGVKSGYQDMRLNIWKSYGATIQIRRESATTMSSCLSIIKEAQQMGQIGGIFNLAVVLRDNLLENQTVSNFETSFAAKADSTTFLDTVTRKHCPDLDHFVVFSSVSCGRGNAGQTNYGMANSIMERICEQRRWDGLAGLAIQWGAIGDVGLVAEMQEEQTELAIGGTLQQRISSCLEVLDKMLGQDAPVVASMVVAEKKSGSGGATNMVDAVVNIMGIRDLKTVSLHSTLPELGMDSMMAVEIKQTLEREYEVYLTPQDIRSMTFSRLQEISQEKFEGTATSKPLSVNQLFRFVVNQELSVDPIVRMTSATQAEGNHKKLPKVFVLPGVEGTSLALEAVVSKLEADVICFQFCSNVRFRTIKDMAQDIFPKILREADDASATFNIVAYSFGSVVALELVEMLEEAGCTCNVVLIDGAPALMLQLVQMQLNTQNDDLFQTSLIGMVMSKFIPFEILNNIQKDLIKCSSYLERIRLVYSRTATDITHSQAYIEDVCISAYNRIKAITLYKKTPTRKFKSAVRLLRPTGSSVQDIAEDYRLGDWCEHPVSVSFFDGDHVTVLDNIQVATAISQAFNLDSSSAVNGTSNATN